jgi:hypothetical protein
LNRGGLLVAGAIASESFDSGLRLPALEDVDAARLHQICADREVEATGCAAGLFNDAHTVREVGLALWWIDNNVPRDDYHVLLLCSFLPRGVVTWPSADGGYLGPPSSTDSWLSGAVARCQQADPAFPRITAHALRHTATSLAISAGANVKVVQRMLGHESAAMTLDV